MVHGFDPLGHDLDIHGFADVDNGGEQASLGGLGQDRVHQLAVDLQAPRTQFQQGDDGGVAGAEIVDLDIDAQLLDAIDIPADERVALVEIDRFHQLEGDAPRLDAQGAQALHQILIMQPALGDIDRGARHIEPPGLPAIEIAQSLLKDDAVYAGDNAQLFGNAHEAVRGLDPLDRMVPAHQGFHADDVERVGIKLRLVERHEGICIERPQDFVSAALGGDNFGLQGFGEEFIAVPAPSLGPVESDIGIDEQLLDVDVVAPRCRKANADADATLVSLVLGGLAHGPNDAVS